MSIGNRRPIPIRIIGLYTKSILPYIKPNPIKLKTAPIAAKVIAIM